MIAMAAFLAVTVSASPGDGEPNDPDGAQSQTCSKVASTTGSDSDPGTESRPFASPQKLAMSLRKGQTGCIRSGTYSGNLRLRRGGAPGAPVTLRSYPGEAARLIGRLVVSRRASHLIIRGLYLDGRNRSRLPSPTVNGRRITFTGNDVTNGHTAICFALGHPDYGTATKVTIKRNRIHDCGELPITNHHHGIYVSVARDTKILGNWIYRNADRGIQLYADAQRTVVRGNVLDANGQGIIFGGDDRVASNSSLVEGNVITGSTVRHNVESHYPPGGPIGAANTVRRNCIAGGARGDKSGGISEPPVGFTSEENLLAAPSFRSLETPDYRFAAPSPCTELFMGPTEQPAGPRRQPSTRFVSSG